MFPNFEEILLELSYRTDNGIVDLSKPAHVSQLIRILEEYNIPNPNQLAESASHIWNSLNEADEFKALNKNGTVSTFGSAKARDTAIKSGSHTTIKTNGGKPKNEPVVKQNIFPTANTKQSDISNDKVINGRSKELNNTNPLSTDEYTKDLEPDDAEFAIKNKKFANPIPPQPFKLPDSIRNNPKYPKKYVKLLERMMNTQQTGNATKLSHYSDLKGGQGKLPAQAGELMAMMGVTMNDNEFKEFKNSISSHIDSLTKPKKLVSDSSRIVTKSWLTSAEAQRKGILKRISKQYPGYQVAASAWDTKSDVEALGMDDYSNKGFSTDIFLRLENSKGEPILDEISLKKDLNVNLLNSGTGKFFEWIGKDNVPDNINPQKFAKSERDTLSKFCKDNADSIKKLVKSDPQLQRVMQEKGIDFETALDDTFNGKGNRHKTKVLLESVRSLQRNGDTNADNLISGMDKAHADYVSNCITAITTNDKLKEGMLNEIKSEFPLKSVADNEESVVLGEYVLDKSTMKHIFGTSDFDEFKQGLISESGPPPFIAYRVKVGGRVIPIANIDVREDGRNYGGQFKFEMSLNKEFSSEIMKANKEIYG